MEKEEVYWGQSVTIDLYNCNHQLLIDDEKIRQFSLELCNKIDMKPYGEPIVKRFGSGRLEGWSFVQLIETSSITGHMDEFDNRAFIDIFSCKTFDSDSAVEFSKEYFQAGRAHYITLHRGGAYKVM